VRPVLLRHAGARHSRFIAVALALLVALQGFAAGALGAIGRLHTHKAATVVVLDDLRRGPAHPQARGDGAARRHGHSHAAGAALRHHHAGADASVNLAGADPLPALDADDAPTGTTLAAFVALVAAAPDWLAPAPGERRGAGAAWVPHTRHPEPFERPPRFA
jgi:hypothetical protein